MQASLLYKSENILAEGPLWHTRRKSFFWVDIDGESFYEYNWATQEVQQWKLEKRPSLLIEHADGNLILGMQGGIAHFDLSTSAMKWLTDLESDIPNNRTNDGGCDAAGRIWIGTMDRQFAAGKGSLHCIDDDLVAKRKIETFLYRMGLYGRWIINECILLIHPHKKYNVIYLIWKQVIFNLKEQRLRLIKKNMVHRMECVWMKKECFG